MQTDISRIKWHCNLQNVKVELSETLVKLLGFTKTSVFTKGTRIAADIYNLQLSLSSLWVYTDIVEPTIVGDSVANLLRIIPVENTAKVGRRTVVRLYERPHYLKIMNNNIGMVEIEVTTSHGLSPILFKDLIVAKLHFRRRHVRND